MELKKEIYCSLSVDATHNWENIPDTFALKDVQFLKFPHRHMFGIKAYKIVNHNDRDLEFIHLKREIDYYLYNKYFHNEQKNLQFGSKSCEMLAEELIEKFQLSKCEVDEDGENGCILEVV